tara:strand:+ start:7151 stop:8464 length:1314 start_codon:yes stop_codon:yes gene_type:complete
MATPPKAPANNASSNLSLQGYGASGTNANQLGGGALQSIMRDPGQVAALGRALQPQKRSMSDYLTEDDKWLVAFKFFTDMAAGASKPGATALGAAGSAGSSAVDFATGIAKQKREEALAATQLGAGLIGKLSKPKTGVPKAVDMGPVTNDDGTPKIDATTGKQLHKFNVFDADGSVRSTYEAVRKGGQTINVGGDAAAFGKVFSKKEAERFSEQLAASSQSSDTIQTLQTLSGILDNPDFDTGIKEEMLLPLKQLSVSFGVGSIDEINQVANAEAFQAMAQKLVLESVSKMKGALSDKELGFLQSQNVTLGKSKAGNKLLLLLSMHQLEKAKEFAPFRLKWENDNGPIQKASDYAKLVNDYRDQPFMKENPLQYVERRAAEDLRIALSNAGADFDPEGKVVDGSIDADTKKKIGVQVSEKYNLPLVKKIFKNSGFRR